MKVVLFIGLSFLFSINCSCQKYDYRWIMGYHQPVDFELFFTENSIDTISSWRLVAMDNSQVTISDSIGNLLFYTNGYQVRNVTDVRMEGGDSLNFGAFSQLYGGYYPALQDIMALRSEKDPNIWNLFHYYYEQFGTGGEFVWRLYQSQVDMSKNSGLGAVTFKNKLLIEDSLGTYVSACRHGNGRDWWVVCSKASSNCLYELLVQPDTVVLCDTQCLGGTYVRGYEGQGVFSPDGAKFAVIGQDFGVLVYDFDRCTGKFSHSTTLPLMCDIPNNAQFGLCFSPNSRFLYATQLFYAMQFDVSATDIWASVDTVAEINELPPDSSFPFAGYYFLMQLAPNGQIYISAINSEKYLHVIDYPDKKGDSCNLRNYGLHLPAFNTFGIPCYPNYRLGRLIGSECDTIYHDDTTHVGFLEPVKSDLKIFPNPAKDNIVIDYGNCDWSYGPMQLEIIDETGKTVLLQQLPMYSGFQVINVVSFPEGFYNVQIRRNNSIICQSKFIRL